MTYWNADETRVDKNGKRINPGDILDTGEVNDPWRYHACFTHNGKNIEVRDLNANNVCMCDLECVTNIGHITEVYKQLGKGWENDDWEYYYYVLPPGSTYDSYNLKERPGSEIRQMWDWNNFPAGWSANELGEPQP